MKLSKKMQRILGTILLVLAVIIWAGEQFGLFGTEESIGVTTEVQSSSKPASTTTRAEGTAATTPTTAKAPASTTAPAQETTAEYVHYYFRSNTLLTQHFEKHGEPEMGFKDKKSYEEAACRVINNPEALHKTEKEDGDLVYYVEKTNEFVVLSKDGYIRTYFLPSGGIAYYNRQ